MWYATTLHLSMPFYYTIKNAILTEVNRTIPKKYFIFNCLKDILAENLTLFWINACKNFGERNELQICSHCIVNGVIICRSSADYLYNLLSTSD